MAWPSVCIQPELPTDYYCWPVCFLLCSVAFINESIWIAIERILCALIWIATPIFSVQKEIQRWRERVRESETESLTELMVNTLKVMVWWWWPDLGTMAVAIIFVVGKVYTALPGQTRQKFYLCILFGYRSMFIHCMSTLSINNLI